MDLEIVFSDVDGTLLNSEHKMLEGTLYSIKCLQKKGVPFVIISARSPSGIYPIMEEYGFSCPIICYSGALILDENRKVIYSTGFNKETAGSIIDFIENKKFDCSWNIYSADNWIVKSKQDSRVILEENIVKAEAVEGSVHSLEENAQVGKILCMCDPKQITEIEREIKIQFPELSVAKSSDTLLEIMGYGINKKSAVMKLCKLWNIQIEKAAAFGDNYNDVEMLETVGFPFLMENAPKELKSQFTSITASNDNEGIYKGLAKIGVISEL